MVVVLVGGVAPESNTCPSLAGNVAKKLLDGSVRDKGPPR